VGNSPFSILASQPPLAHERFSAHREIEALLKKSLRDPLPPDLIRFDLGRRALYASDASNYRQLPIGVICPRDVADVEAALAACRQTGAAVLPRGAGTSLSGQCVNVAVVFDYSRSMNALLSIDPETKLARVQPGIVLDRLRDAAEAHHLTYAPDPATHSRCTLGGILGNNSCGVHGLMGGKAVDNVESLEILLYDGTRLTVGRTSHEKLEALIRSGGRVGEIYSGLKRVRDKYSVQIREKFPRIPRRVSGYNLDELLPENGFHVARALVGSEGTCASILTATLNLTASPPYRVLTVLGFADAFQAADAVPAILEHHPIGLEGFDSMLTGFLAKKGKAREEIALLPPGGGFLLVEMGAWEPGEAQAKAEALAAAAQAWPAMQGARIYSPQDAARIWRVRESSLGATVFVPGEPEGWEGWEDAGVPPERLGSYLRALTALMGEYGYRSPLYGHYGQGCVHLRINFDFHSREGIRRYREFIERAADLVLAHGGSLSGEHGDGQSRAALLPKMFGPELVQAFREFKAIWDPDGRMNPGKLSDPVRVYDPIENLRHGIPPEPAPGDRNRAEGPANFSTNLGNQGVSGAPGSSPPGTGETTTADPSLRASSSSSTTVGAPSIQSSGQDGGLNGWEPQEAKNLETHFVFANDQGSMQHATERCVGIGACRNTVGGVMCPSYRATGDEQHSTRGRARLLWEMLSGALREEGFRSRAVFDALDLCLSCKACKSECPVQVDMAAYKAEFLAQHYKGRPHPLQHYLFGFADRLARMGSFAPALTNAILTGPLTSPLVKRIGGIAAQRQLPRLAPESFQKSRGQSPKPFQERSGAPGSSHLGTGEERSGDLPQRVLLWPDTWNNYYRPQALVAAEALLIEAGFRVEVPRGHLCCGRPLYDFGFLTAARSYLTSVLDRMAPQIDSGLPFLFLEPSCASVFRDELLEFFPNDERAQRLSRQAWLVADFLAAHAPGFASKVLSGRLSGTRILVHGHCHRKAVFGGSASEIALLRQAGAQVDQIEAGCCGMAGPFGFESRKYEVSKAIARDGLLPALAAAAPEVIIAADGFSCREQIEQLARRSALHPVEVLVRNGRVAEKDTSGDEICGT
jgi:FAD/FMN-containing dehydrogenase/Fe-S oxidoreductase